MRILVIILLAIATPITGFVGYRIWQWNQMWPKASTEVVQFTADKRNVLLSLRAEHKFQPHDYPPLGYTGADTPEDEVVAIQAVNSVIDEVLAQPDGPLAAQTVSDDIGKGMRQVDTLATEDRERTQGYMIEIWYRLGFKGATGRFAYGAAFPKPPGYGEPLPPGWASPTSPRPIGR